MQYRKARIRRKDALWIRTGGRCGYCGGKTKRMYRTRDHIVPKVKGGKTVDANLIASCRQCNQNKADFDLEDFRKFYFDDDLFYIEWLEGEPLVPPVHAVEAAD